MPHLFRNRLVAISLASMLVGTYLIGEIKESFHLIDKWNAHPFSYPYKLIYSKFEGRYKFQANRLFYRWHWPFHFAVLLSGFIFGSIKIVMESKTIFATCVTGFIGGVAGLESITAIFHKKYCKQFAGFLNELIRFEERHVLKGEKGKYKWRDSDNDKNQMSEVVRWASRFFSVAHLGESFLFGVSTCLFPGVAWNVLPKIITYGIFPENCGVLNEIGRRALIFYYNYVGLRVFTNFANINIVISLLMCNYCFCSSMIHFQR